MGSVIDRSPVAQKYICRDQGLKKTFIDNHGNPTVLSRIN